jgi:hypothetical protein
MLMFQRNLTGVTWQNMTSGNSEIVVGSVYITPGAHNIYHIDPTVVFSCISSGVASLNSYSVPTGMRLAEINAVSGE